MTRDLLTAALALLVIAGCSRHRATTTEERPTEIPSYRGSSATRPLEGYAGQRVGVLPVQTLRRDDTMGWGDRVANASGGDALVVLASLDSAIAATLRARGLAGWASSDAVARAAKRNPTYAPDVHALALAQLQQAERRPDVPIEDPLAGQLRTLAGLSDARFLLMPIRIRFERRDADGKTTGRPAVDIALLDARLSQLLWRGVVTGDYAANLADGWQTTIAQRVADLAVGR